MGKASLRGFVRRVFNFVGVHSTRGFGGRRAPAAGRLPGARAVHWGPDARDAWGTAELQLVSRSLSQILWEALWESTVGTYKYYR